MITIRPSNQILAIDQRLRFNSLQRTTRPEDLHNSILNATQRIHPVPAKIDLIRHLPYEHVQSMNHLLRSINLLAIQALEPGLDFKFREHLQTEVKEDISKIRSVLGNFKGDDLTLFNAIIKNQTLGVLFDTGGTSRDSFFGISSQRTHDNLMDNLLGINILTESGALIALDLSGRIIDNFTQKNDFKILESLLGHLTHSYLGTTIFNTLSPTRESGTATISPGAGTASDPDNSGSVTPRLDNLSPDADSETIIDLVG